MIPRFKPWLGWPEFLALFKKNIGAVENFEKEFAKTFDAVEAIAFPYGRSAQWAFFNAIGIKNAEVIMPAYTCSVVAHAITLSGNIPRFIDINLYDYNMNLDDAELAINKNTRAIIATHTFGYPQDLDRLESMVKRAEKLYGHKVWLIQDCCHAFGAEWKGKKIGASGDVAIYAFNISKIITSIFGGMLTFQDKALADKVRDWRDKNYKAASWFKAIQRRIYLLAVYVAFHEKFYSFTLWLQKKTSLLNKFTRTYHLDNKIHFPPDYLDKMLDVEAAVGLEQLKKYSKIIKHRIEKAKYYDKNLQRKEGWRLPPIIDGATYSHYTVRVPNRDKVISEYNSKGIELGELIQYCVADLEEYSSSKSNYPHSHKASTTSINFTVSK
jgi:perosamine synthetase